MSDVRGHTPGRRASIPAVMAARSAGSAAATRPGMTTTDHGALGSSDCATIHGSKIEAQAEGR